MNARSWGTYGIAAGGLGSTVGDVLRWEEALRGGTVISLNSKRLMETPVRLSVGLNLDYGFGTRFGTIGVHRGVAHSGNGEGWTSAAVRLDDAHLIVVVLTNTESYTRHAQTIACAIARRLTGISDPVVNNFSPSSGEKIGMIGNYQNGFQLTFQDGNFFAQLEPGAPRDRLLYQGKAIFVLEDAHDVSLSIVRDQHGERWVVARAGGMFAFAAAEKHLKQ